MKCKNRYSRLFEYLDGALSPRRADEMRRHLAQCESCRHELAALQRTVKAVRDLPRRPAPPGLADRVMRRLLAESSAPLAGGVPTLSMWPRAVAVAAMFLVVVGVTLVLERREFLGSAAPSSAPLAMRMEEAARGERREEHKEQIELAESSDRAAEPAIGGPAALKGPGGLRERDDHAKMALSAGVPPAGEGMQQVAVREGEVEGSRLREAGMMELVSGSASRAVRQMAVEEATREEQPERAVEPTRRAQTRSTFFGAQATEQLQEDGMQSLRYRAGGKPGARRQRVVFNQVVLPAPELPLDLDVEPDQILAVAADEPLELAQRMVELANANGINEVVLALTSGEDAGPSDVEVAIRVPAPQYEDFLWQVSQVSPLQEQRLVTNTIAIVTDEDEHAYLKDVARRYNEELQTDASAAYVRLTAGRPARAGMVEARSSADEVARAAPGRMQVWTEGDEEPGWRGYMRRREALDAIGLDSEGRSRGDVNLLILLVPRITPFGDAAALRGALEERADEPGGAPEPAGAAAPDSAAQ